VSKDSGNQCHDVGVADGDEVRHLGKPVNHREGHELAIDAREALHEVHRDISPHDGWHIEGLEKAGRVKVFALILLACHARPDTLPHD
jgi:hypothetical protein